MEDCIAKFYCFDFTTNEDVVEFRVHTSTLGFSISKGIHERDKSHQIPTYKHYAHRYSNVSSAFTQILLMLRNSELKYNHYPKLKPGQALPENYRDTLKALIDRHNAYDRAGTNELTICSIYGNRYKFPDHQKEWDYWRPWREKIKAMLGYESIDDPSRYLLFYKLMNEEQDLIT